MRNKLAIEGHFVYLLFHKPASTVDYFFTGRPKLAYEDNESLMQYTQLLENLITQQIEREIDLLTDSPSERLHRVLNRSPDLFQQIPLKYIASYLRMSPETLSRIRNS